MIIVNIQDNENIERALKRFKQKFDRTGVLREVRDRSYFEKPSIGRRTEKIKAAYKQKMYGMENY